MTTSIGLYFVIFILAMIPMVFLGAGKDTTLCRAEQKQRQEEALLDWTDKAKIRGEEINRKTVTNRKYTANIPVEIIHSSRELADSTAA